MERRRTEKKQKERAEQGEAKDQSRDKEMPESSMYSTTELRQTNALWDHELVSNKVTILLVV